jgi:hypothetical protein
VLALAGGLLAACALVTAVLGPVHVELGPLTLSIASPFRPLGQGIALLLVTEALVGGSSREARRRFITLFAALIATLCLESRPRVVGDGNEYVAMAWSLSQGRPPAVTPREYRDLQTSLSPVLDRYPLAAVGPPGPDGRLGFCHSWMYPLLVAPLVRATSLTRLPPLAAFTVANLILLVFAATMVHARAGPGVTLLVLGGPCLWWADKPHPELFVMGTLVAAVSVLPERPGLSLLLQGLAGLQYLVFGVALPASSVWLARRGGLREPGTQAGLGAGILLVLLGPASQLWWAHRPVPLLRTLLPHVPGLAELTGVMVDPNLGLVFAWPSLAIAWLLGVVATWKRRAARRDTVVLLALVSAVLLVVVALPANLNHGGTRGMSRYALWLVPLCAPALLSLAREDRRRGVLVALGAASLGVALGDYHPRKAERYLSPSLVAGWLWERWPGVNDPLPEVFAERTAGVEGELALPAATEGCEKALLVGNGTPRALWPLWCRPYDLPSECQPEGTFCYANRHGVEYRFVRAPGQPAFEAMRPGAWSWTGAPSDELVLLLSRFTRSTIWSLGPGNELFAGRRRLGRRRTRTDGESMLIWLTQPRSGAWIELKPGRRRRAVLIDPRQARILESVAVDSAAPTRLVIPPVAPLLLVVAPEPSGVPPRTTPRPAEPAATDRTRCRGRRAPTGGSPRVRIESPRPNEQEILS